VVVVVEVDVVVVEVDVVVVEVVELVVVELGTVVVVVELVVVGPPSPPPPCPPLPRVGQGGQPLFVPRPRPLSPQPPRSRPLLAETAVVVVDPVVVLVVDVGTVGPPPWPQPVPPAEPPLPPWSRPPPPWAWVPAVLVDADETLPKGAVNANPAARPVQSAKRTTRVLTPRALAIPDSAMSPPRFAPRGFVGFGLSRAQVKTHPENRCGSTTFREVSAALGRKRGKTRRFIDERVFGWPKSTGYVERPPRRGRHPCDGPGSRSEESTGGGFNRSTRPTLGARSSALVPLPDHHAA
jgi:hypothetical protein